MQTKRYAGSNGPRIYADGSDIDSGWIHHPERPRTADRPVVFSGASLDGTFRHWLFPSGTTFQRLHRGSPEACSGWLVTLPDGVSHDGLPRIDQRTGETSDGILERFATV